MKQQGLVMVFALLVLMSLTILGVASVSSSLLQSKMAVGMEKQSLAFDAAEAAIAGVVFESEDDAVLSDTTLLDPLSEARQNAAIDLTNETLSCFETTKWANRRITDNGLNAGVQQTAAGTYHRKPGVNSWSRTAFLTERSCLGSSNVIGGSNISCHVFMVRGCGQVVGSKSVVANTLNVSVFAPVSE